MKTILFSLFIFNALPSFSQSGITVAEASGQGHKFLNAMIEEDVATVRSLMTNDFLLVSFDGQLLGNHMLVDGLSKGVLVIDSGKVEETDVRVYGETGIVTGKWKVKGVVDGTAHDRELVYTLVVVRQAADWRIASLQLSPFPE